METAEEKIKENNSIATRDHGECLSCGCDLKSPKERMRMDDGRCLCTTCYRGFLQPGARERIPECMG